MKNLKEFINEQSFGASDADEKRAGAASDRMAGNKSFSGGNYNKKSFKREMVTYFLKKEVKEKISDSRVLVSELSKNALKIKSKGFKDFEDVKEIILDLFKNRKYTFTNMSLEKAENGQDLILKSN